MRRFSLTARELAVLMVLTAISLAYVIASVYLAHYWWTR